MESIHGLCLVSIFFESSHIFSGYQTMPMPISTSSATTTTSAEMMNP